MRRYNIINDLTGWACFVVAAITYLLTIEPTASFWDCPEFITQGYKLEVGHPPGNPIFMLTARFFVTLFGGSASVAAVAVNSMSALLSAATILLLFWTITHLARKLIVKSDAKEISPLKTLLIMGAGVCGALAYTWSDTFWFSAVEGEVYAFSSFCTALVFWLILKWENRADNPRSDRYLVLIAYIIGISIAVHLLNLLCIPAIVLVIYYRKFKNTNVVGSLVALALSAVIVALILFGLVPGFVAVAQRFELFFVNVLGASYNTGVLVYALLTIAVFIWTIAMIRKQKSAGAIKTGVLLSIILSGMPFIGHGWLVPTIFIAALVVYLFVYCKHVPIRIFNLVILSVFVIFIGYSSYALLLIRSTANTPMNQNAPDNVFALGSYLNREQYGDTPIFYGPKMSETIQYQMARDEYDNIFEYVEVDENGVPEIRPTVVGPRLYTMEGTIVDNGRDKYGKVVKGDTSEPDRYEKAFHDPEYVIPDGMGMLFPRMYSDDGRHVNGYKSWSLYTPDMTVNAPAAVKQKWAEQGYVKRAELERYMNMENTTETDATVAIGNSLSYGTTTLWQPSLLDNLKYFFNYQLNHMYWRYFMWNFAGRQNDIAGNGEPHQGNWISGIPFIDNTRLGDQSLLPEYFTTENAGHNVFYMLPLLLGVIGLLWQACMVHVGGEKRGIEQFWVVFFLFFMTGIAIVLYLNQPPGQPRERDYAFAGSFYAFAIWIGLGVPGLFMMLRKLWGLCMPRKRNTGGKSSADEGISSSRNIKTDWAFACFAVAVGLFVPLQMVSQTWDDHDRSGRYAARDFGMNYLNSLDDNAIIFVNGDNDTFPLWYAQEVEGVRTDVKVVNLSYLSQDWYARQVAMDSYDADRVPFYMPNVAMNNNKMSYYVVPGGTPGKNLGLSGDVTAEQALEQMYATGPVSLADVLNNPRMSTSPYYVLGGPNIDNVYVPLSKETIEEKYGVYPVMSPWNTTEADTTDVVTENVYRWNMTPSVRINGGQPSPFAGLLTYDIIARSATEGFKRPVYFASTVHDAYAMGFADNIYQTGMALEVTPFSKSYGDRSPVVVKAYENIIGKFRWGGIDSDKKIYLDETVRRMVSSTRSAVLQIAQELLENPTAPAPESAKEVSAEKGLPVPANYADMAANLLNYMNEKLPERQAPYENGIEYYLGKTYVKLGTILRDPAYLEKAKTMLQQYVDRVAGIMAYSKTLNSNMHLNLLRAENANIEGTLTALSLINYADLQLASIEGKLPADQLSGKTESMLGDFKGINYQILFYLYQPDVDDLAQFGHFGADMSTLLDIFATAGVDPFARINDFASNAQLSLEDLQELYY